MLTQKALELFEQALRGADHNNDKIVFAEETVRSVKAKLEKMKHSVGMICLIPLDYNERVVIRQSILMYSIELLDKPPSVRQTKELHQCRQISEGLTDPQAPTL